MDNPDQSNKLDLSKESEPIVEVAPVAQEPLQI